MKEWSQVQPGPVGSPFNVCLSEDVVRSFHEANTNAATHLNSTLTVYDRAGNQNVSPGLVPTIPAMFWREAPSSLMDTQAVLLVQQTYAYKKPLAVGQAYRCQLVLSAVRRQKHAGGHKLFLQYELSGFALSDRESDDRETTALQNRNHFRVTSWLMIGDERHDHRQIRAGRPVYQGQRIRADQDGSIQTQWSSFQTPAFSTQWVQRFVKCVDDRNPLHTDAGIAVSKGLAGPPVPGVLMLGQVWQAAKSGVPREKLPCACQKLQARFVRPLVAGKSLKILYEWFPLKSGMRLDFLACADGVLHLKGHAFMK